MLNINIAEKLSLITDSFAEDEDELTAEMSEFEDVTTESSFDFETDSSLGRSSCEEGFGCVLVDSQSGSSQVGRRRDCLSEQASGERIRYESESSVQPSVELGPVKNFHQCLAACQPPVDEHDEICFDHGIQSFATRYAVCQPIGDGA